MYTNTGEKIQTMAKVIAVISIIAALIAGAVIWVEFNLPLLGFIIAVVGGFMAWVSQLLLAGFGELISNSHKILIVFDTANRQ